jgi:hypothetical protein
MKFKNSLTPHNKQKTKLPKNIENQNKDYY